MSEITIAKLMELRTGLVSRIDAASAKLKESIETDSEKLKKLEALIHEKMLASGDESIKTAFGTAFFKLHESFPVKDKVKFMKWVKDADMWHVVPAQMLKPEAKEYVKEHGGELPPGIEYSGFKKLNFRKPTKKVGE